MRVCPQCRSDRLVNNGSAAGKPKKRCKQCGYQFTRTTPRGKPLRTKINAVLFYLSGMSMNRIAFLLQVSAQAVLNWLRAFAKKYYEKTKPTGNIIILELDEMWHYLKNKRRKLWIWKALDRDPGHLLDWPSTSEGVIQFPGGLQGPAWPCLPLSVPEIRRLLWRLVLAVQQTAQHVVAWSHWRRWHQRLAQYDHDKRRGALAKLLAA
jgi:transposase-like protein